MATKDEVRDHPAVGPISKDEEAHILRFYTGGKDFSEARWVCVQSLDFEDYDTIEGLTSALRGFRTRNSDCAISRTESEDNVLTGFVARRQETPEEVSARIEAYLVAFRNDTESRARDTRERRALYETLKAKFEPAGSPGT